jgi:hypothetical protein
LLAGFDGQTRPFRGIPGGLFGMGRAVKADTRHAENGDIPDEFIQDFVSV